MFKPVFAQKMKMNRKKLIPRTKPEFAQNMPWARDTFRLSATQS